jgi:hypothetical protein
MLQGECGLMRIKDVFVVWCKFRTLAFVTELSTSATSAQLIV